MAPRLCLFSFVSPCTSHTRPLVHRGCADQLPKHRTPPTMGVTPLIAWSLYFLRVCTYIWESFSRLFHTWTTSFSKLFQVLLLCLYEQKHQQQLHEVQLTGYCESIPSAEWWWQQQHFMTKNPMAVSINSLNWLMIFKVFQFVLYTRKIIAERWNNRYPCWVIFQVSPHTFRDFSKLFHT